MKNFMLFMQFIIWNCIRFIALGITIAACYDAYIGNIEWKSVLFLLFILCIISSITRLSQKKYKEARFKYKPELPKSFNTVHSNEYKENNPSVEYKENRPTQNKMAFMLKKIYLFILLGICRLINIVIFFTAIALLIQTINAGNLSHYTDSENTEFIVFIVLFVAFWWIMLAITRSLRTKYTLLKNETEKTDQVNDINAHNVYNIDSDNSYEKGIAFEMLCADSLKNNGWSVVLTKASGDEGVDIIAEKNNHRVAIQCKNYDSSVNVDAIREVHTGKSCVRAHHAAVVCRRNYTNEAVNTAQKCNVHIFSSVEELLLGLENLVN